MKNLLKIALVILSLISVLSLVGCGEKSVRFGVGSYTLGETKDSNNGGEGNSSTTVTVAAVLLDNEGKIKDCAIDSIEIKAKFTADGKVKDLGELKSKYQLGDAYGMKKYGNSKGEWYEEVNSFIGVVKGKTITDVKALVATDKKGNEDVINAGCTIKIDELVMALEKAANNAQQLDNKDSGNVKLNFSAKQTEKKDATETENGEIKATVVYSGELLNKDGKAIKTYEDEYHFSARFDNKGKNID